MAFNLPDSITENARGLAIYVEDFPAPFTEYPDDIEDRLFEVYEEIRSGSAVLIASGSTFSLVPANLITRVDIF
jgi:hypothetical protein